MAQMRQSERFHYLVLIITRFSMCALSFPNRISTGIGKIQAPRRYVVQMNARGPRPTVLTHCYHWICITPYGMCTRRGSLLRPGFILCE